MKKKIASDSRKITLEKKNYIESNKKREKEKKQNEYNYALKGEKYIQSIKKDIEKAIENIKLSQANKDSIKNAKNVINQKLTDTKEKMTKNKKSNPNESVRKKDLKLDSHSHQ